MNLYAYVWNDPYNWSDPSGLSQESEDIQLTAFAAVAVRTGALTAGALATEYCIEHCAAMADSTASGIESAAVSIAGYLNFLAQAIPDAWAWLSESNPDPSGPGIGHNGGPKLEDNGSQPPTPDLTALLTAMIAAGVKFNADNIVDIAQLSDGSIVWLETGTASAGLRHIVDEHGADFAAQGISQDQIAEAIMTALRQGKVVGYQGKGTGRPIYEYKFNGNTYRTAITIGDNGYIVGANPRPRP